MSKEYQPDRRFSTVISSRLLPPIPARPGIPTTHRETALGTRIITLGEPITPFLPRHKVRSETEETPWSKTTVLLDSHLRFPSGTPFPRFPLTFGHVGDCLSARIRREHIAAQGFLTSDSTMRPAPLELFRGLSLTLSFPNGEEYTAFPTYTDGWNTIDLVHGFVSFGGFRPLTPTPKGKPVLYPIPLTNTDHLVGVRDFEQLYQSTLTMRYEALPEGIFG